MKFTRIPETTFQKLQLNAGILCSAFDPTTGEVEESALLGATSGGVSFSDFFKEVRSKYPDQLFMADTSCFEEGKLALQLGFDLLGTTKSGYIASGKTVTDKY